MSAEDFINAVGVLGFPIVACCGLFWFIVKQNTTVDTLTKILAELKTLIEERVNNVDKGD